MKHRDKLKEKAKAIASRDGRKVSDGQTELCDQYKKMRNKINNRTRQEEINFKKSKVQECQDNPSRSWRLAKKFMDWSSPGPPTQLEVEADYKITLYRKARDLANIMNEFFI